MSWENDDMAGDAGHIIVISLPLFGETLFSRLTPGRSDWLVRKSYRVFVDRMYRNAPYCVLFVGMAKVTIPECQMSLKLTNGACYLPGCC